MESKIDVPTVSELGDIANKTSDWIRSSEGVRTMTEAFIAAAALESQLAAARRVDPRNLHEPVTL